MELRFYPDMILGGWRLVNLNWWLRGVLKATWRFLFWPMSRYLYTHRYRHVLPLSVTIYFHSFYDSNLLRHQTFFEMSHCSTCKCASVPTSQFNFKRKVGYARLPVKAVGMMPNLDINDIHKCPRVVDSIDWIGSWGQEALEICSALCFFLRWIECTACLSHRRKWFNTTHDPPEVILSLLIAVGTCKCVFLPQVYLPTSGIDINLHCPARKSLWFQSQAIRVWCSSSCTMCTSPVT